MASNVDDAAGFGSGACSGTHLDPLLQRDNFKNCKGQQRFDILQPVILAGSLSGGRILSTSSVQIGFEHMSGLHRAKQEILLTASMRSGNHNQEKQLKSLTNHLQEKHVAKVASQAGDAAGFGSGACDI